MLLEKIPLPSELSQTVPRVLGGERGFDEAKWCSGLRSKVAARHTLHALTMAYVVLDAGLLNSCLHRLRCIVIQGEFR